MKTISSFTFNNNFNYSFNSIKESLKRKETKVFALVSHWAAGLVVDIFTFIVLVLSTQYLLSLAVLALIAYHTYAVVGTVQELF